MIKIPAFLIWIMKIKFQSLKIIQQNRIHYVFIRSVKSPEKCAQRILKAEKEEAIIFGKEQIMVYPKR